MSGTGKSILLISTDVAVTDAISHAISGMDGVDMQSEATQFNALNGRAVALAADKEIVIFETSDDEISDIAAIRAFKFARKAGTLMLALADSGITLSRVRALNQAGVDYVVPKHDAGPEIGSRVKQHFAGIQHARISLVQERRGRIIAVAQARGGVGATTVTVNLANELAEGAGFFKRKQKHSVALVDLDVQFGSVGTLLDLPDQNVLHEMALAGTIPDAAFLAKAMATLPNGMSVLPAPTKFMPLDSLQPAQIAAILDTLRQSNDFVIVDLPHALGGWIEPVLRRADELIIVSDTAVPSVRHCRRLIDFYSADNPELRIRVVINHEKRSLFWSGVQKEVQKALDLKLDHWLPHDPSAARISADRGKPLSSVAPRSQLGRAIARLAKQTLSEFPVTHPTAIRGR